MCSRRTANNTSVKEMFRSSKNIYYKHTKINGYKNFGIGVAMTTRENKVPDLPDGMEVKEDKRESESSETLRYHFWHNNALFITQVMFGLLAFVFSASMLISGKDPGIYLPIMTGVLGYFLPSPINHKVVIPAGQSNSDAFAAMSSLMASPPSRHEPSATATPEAFNTYNTLKTRSATGSGPGQAPAGLNLQNLANLDVNIPV
jgi:hypothetical protein